MREPFIKILNVDAKQLHDQLSQTVIEDTKENVIKNRNKGVYMGKVGAKKFYLLYKPPYMRNISYMTILRGDISPMEDGTSKIRYRFGKFKMTIALASVLLVLVTGLALFAFFSGETNALINLCIIGFWVLSVGLNIYCMISTKAAQERLLEFIDDLAKK